ncbi:HNH endonuclease [Citrobacter freundii]|uniref:HNH endonuclease n=1 Tax=Citrobacter freundii TaxID=546 RepID=UPI003A87DAFC
MIKLERNFIPPFFTDENIAVLTHLYKTEGKHVWQNDSVKEACLTLGNRKCAYCEVVLNQKSTYMEVEHFKHKDDYPDEVIQWDNLLPSCRHCNGTKSDHDVVAEPIINPCVDNPSDHIYLKAYRIKGKSSLGDMTVDALNLNDLEHYVTERCKVGTFIEEQIEKAVKKLSNYSAVPNPARKRELNKVIKALLNQCQKSALFSAVSSTMLHSNEEYEMVRLEMITYGIWTEQFEELHQSSLVLILSTSK